MTKRFHRYAFFVAVAICILMPILFSITEHLHMRRKYVEKDGGWVENKNLQREIPYFKKTLAPKDFIFRESMLNGEPDLDMDKPSHNKQLSPLDKVYNGYNDSVLKDRTSLSPGQLYATYGCATPHGQIGYAFYLPLTALAWERIGFKSIILIAGTKDQWNKSEALKYILKHLEKRDCVVRFVDSAEINQLSISQISRLFAYKFHNVTENDYLLTTDADIWPLQRDFYIVDNNRIVISTNAFCCEPFTHKNKLYQMRPMGSIGTYVKYWKLLMEEGHNFSVSEIPDGESILNYFQQEFGNMVYRPVTKGENMGWFLDQRMISVRLDQFAQNHGPGTIQLVPRNVARDRIDRSAWDAHTLRGKLDVHLIDYGYHPHSWLQLRQLLELMYGSGTPEFLWAEEYRSGFLHLAESR